MTRYRKAILISIVILLIVGTWLVGFIKINHRFPQPVIEEYHADQWLDYENAQITPVQMDIYSGTQFAEIYSDIGKSFANQNSKIIVAKVKIKNNSNSKLDSMKFYTRFNVVAYPIGYENQGMLVDLNNIYVLPGEEKEVSTYYMVSQALVSDQKMDEFLNSKFYMGVRLYPIKQILVFDNIIIH